MSIGGIEIPVKKNYRTINEINEKIRTGDVQVLTALEMKKLVESSGVEVALKEVDVVINTLRISKGAIGSKKSVRVTL